jgi:MFS family permease
MGAIFFYWPKAFGKLLDERLGKIQFWLQFAGFNLTFFPMHFLGLAGMPRRYSTYGFESGWWFWNVIATIGALLSAVSPGLGVLILGNSVLEGVGTALLIPPVYILTTLRFSDLTSRARAFGVISGLGGLGAAAGPLIGGLITTAISWRAAFIFQAAVIALIVLAAALAQRLLDPIENVFGKLLGVVEQLFHVPFEVR